MRPSRGGPGAPFGPRALVACRGPGRRSRRRWCRPVVRLGTEATRRCRGAAGSRRCGRSRAHRRAGARRLDRRGAGGRTRTSRAPRGRCLGHRGDRRRGGRDGHRRDGGLRDGGRLRDGRRLTALRASTRRRPRITASAAPVLLALVARARGRLTARLIARLIALATARASVVLAVAVVLARLPVLGGPAAMRGYGSQGSPRRRAGRPGPVRRVSRCARFQRDGDGDGDDQRCGSEEPAAPQTRAMSQQREHDCPMMRPDTPCSSRPEGQPGAGRR
jgi:hypothetical protein